MRTRKFWLVAAVLGVGVVAWGGGSTAVETPSPHTARASSSDAALKLRQDMRKLWTDHTVWTRVYIIAAAGDQPDQQAAANRLMKNQEETGDAIGAYYGKTSGKRLTDLLKEHIQGAVDLMKASKAKDTTGAKQIDEAWHRNAEDIAAFLAGANPNWSRSDLSDMMKMHLSTTKDEVTARLEKKWDRDVEAYDKVYEHILKMADALSDGIIKQFPDKF